MLPSNGYGGPVDDRVAPGRRAAPRPNGPRPPRSRKNPKHYKERSFWRELPMLVIVALGLALLIKTFLVQAFFIPSGSMENTLEVDDRVLVNKLSYKVGQVQRGDVIVFDGLGSWDSESGPAPVEPPPSDPVSGALEKVGDLLAFTASNEVDYIKRVIGVPGDRVQCCDDRGRVTVNGVPLNEGNYLHPGNSPSDEPFDRTVPEGRLWVMGDHRAMSLDSRGHDNGASTEFGTIPIDHVIGRAFVIVWPLERVNVLARPPSFADAALAMRPEDAAPLAGIGVGVPLLGLQALRMMRASRGRPARLRSRGTTPAPPFAPSVRAGSRRQLRLRGTTPAPPFEPSVRAGLRQHFSGSPVTIRASARAAFRRRREGERIVHTDSKDVSRS